MSREHARGEGVSGRVRSAGYTLFEMLVVLGIMLVLATIMLPSLSGFFKTSKIEEAAQTVRVALMTAQMQSLRTRTSAGLFFDYPHDGMMEVWTFRTNNEGSWLVTTPDGDGGTLLYSAKENAAYYKVHRASSKSYHLPDGVKVIGAKFNKTTGDLSWPCWSDTPVGRLKAHWVGYQLTGKKVGWSNVMFCYTYYVVIDEGSGEYAIIHHGESQMGRPRVHYNWTIKSIEGTPLTGPGSIWPIIQEKTYPYDSGVIYSCN